MASLDQLKDEPYVPALPHVEEHIKEFQKGVYKVTNGVWVAIGFAIANSICVETKTGLVIIDVLENVESARIVCKEFKRLTSNKPIKSIIFTHAHMDHIGGIKGFTENETQEPTIYLHEDCTDHQMRNQMFKYGVLPRSSRQFGMILDHKMAPNIKKQKNWFKNAGIGPSLNMTARVGDDGNYSEQYEMSLPNTKTYKTFGKSYSFYQDDTKFEMIAAFGETDNQILIHVPSRSLLLPGDNIYRSFPNLYAIRGVDPRDAYAWYKSIEKMIEYVEKYNICHMAPSHSRHIIGYDNILSILGVYRDGISFVHDQTIRYLNQGYDIDSIVSKVKQDLPQQLFQHPYLLEFYGTIEWGIKAIYNRNMGWFSGNIIDLFPSSKDIQTKYMFEMIQFISNNFGNVLNMESEEKILNYIKWKINTKNAQNRDNINRFLLELTTKIKININNNNKKMKNKFKITLNETNEIRYNILRDMASYQTSSPARNYLLSYWLEEKYDLEAGGGGMYNDYTNKIPIKWMINAIPFHVNPRICSNIIGVIHLSDINEIYQFELKNIGVLYLKIINNYNINNNEIDWILKTNDATLKYIMTNTDNDNNNDNKIVKTGHMIPRIRSSVAALIAILFGLIASDDPKKNGLIKGQTKAIQFFKCLEINVISKL